MAAVCGWRRVHPLSWNSLLALRHAARRTVCCLVVSCGQSLPAVLCRCVIRGRWWCTLSSGGVWAEAPCGMAICYSGTLCWSAAVLSIVSLFSRSSVSPVGVSYAALAVSVPRLFTSIAGARVWLGKMVPVGSGRSVRSADRAAVLIALFTSVCGPGRRASAGAIAPLHARSPGASALCCALSCRAGLAAACV